VCSSDLSGIFRGASLFYTLSGQIILGGTALTCWVQDSNKTVIFENMPVSSNFYKISGETGTITQVDLQGVTWLGLAAAPFDFDFSALTTGDDANFSGDVFSDGNLVKFGVRIVADNTTYNRVANIQPFGITINDPIFNFSALVTLTATNDLISGGTTNTHDTAINVAFITTNSLNKIENHMSDNTGGTGHFVEITATGTYDWDGNVTSGYAGTIGSNLVASSGNSSATIYNNSGGAVTINVINGATTPSVRNGATATTTVNAGVVSTAVNVKDQAGANIINARVVVETAAAGGEPYQDSISITSAAGVATATHTGHGMATNDWMVIRGASPASYSKVAQITVTGANTYTYAVTSGIASPATGTPVASFVPLYGLTDASGNITASRTWGASQAVSGYARKSTVTPFYKTSNFAGTVSNTLGFSANITLLDDE